MRSEFDNQLNGEEVPRWLRFAFLIRFCLLIQAATTVSLAWWSQSSLTARLIERGGTPATVVLCAMSGMVLVGLADAFINDVLPDRFSLLCVKSHRHVGYMMLGATYVMQVFAGLEDSPTGAGILLANYAAAAIACGAFSAAATLRPRYAL